jgi:predicted GH43/DUF377 family glycosyl hydrolase
LKWVKKGLVYVPDGILEWAKHTVMTPTPILIRPEIIRVYAGFRNDAGVSRIGFVDVDANNPIQVLSVSTAPVLDIGIPGMFDDNGVILGDVVLYKQKLYMYYVGFQLVQKVKFLAYTGLAISNDGGDTFERYSHSPVLDRTNQDLYIRAMHSVLVEDDTWKGWYASGNGWEWIDGKPFPRYNIHYTESTDGIHFDENSRLCVDVEGDEYRIGRPRVMKDGSLYKMFYTYGTKGKEYLPGYAESTDGINWTRMDEKLGLHPSATGWDSKMLCYLSVIPYKDKIYGFYNGNNMGETGVGYAELIST